MTQTIQTHDIGRTRWFRTLVGILWALVVALVALGLYTMEPGAVVALLSSGYVLSTLIFTGAVFVVTYAISRHFPLRTPPGQRYSHSR